MLIGLLLYFYRFNPLIILIFFLLIRLNYSTTLKSNIGKVVEINEGYYIVKVKNTKVYLKSKQKFSYDDKLEFKDESSLIIKEKSKINFSFENYLLKNNVNYKIKDEQIKLISKGNSIKNILYNYILKHQDANLINKLLFNVNTFDLDKELINLVLSFGLFVRGFISSLTSIFNKFFYKNQSFIFEILLYLIYLLLFKNTLYVLNIIIYKLLNKSSIERLDGLFISSLLILLISPYYVFNLSFQLTFLFRFVYLISNSKNNLVITTIILIPFNLIHFYYVNIFDIILFKFYKFISFISFILLFIDLIFMSSFLTLFLNYLNFSISFKVSGKINLIILLLWIFFSLKILYKFNIKQILILTLLLYLNQNQSLFNPFLTYHQLDIGQGDSAVITYPFKNKLVMIDSGPNFSQQKLQRFLDYYGYRKIMYLIVSHDDLDHSGNNDFLVDNYCVENIIEHAANFNFYNLNITTVKFDEVSNNDASLITFFQVNDLQYLSLGDISKHVEIKLLKKYPYLKPNIIKLAHHGSDTSSSDELLSLESIKLLINSSGKNNLYKHPNFRVLKRILKYNLIFLDTQQVGHIKISHFFNYNFISY